MSAASTLTARRGPALAVLCFVQFMLILDDNVVSIALPTIRGDLGFSATGLSWVVNAYFLAFGGLLLLFGRAGDFFGRRRVFLTGVALFGAASLLCGVAQEPWQLVTGRFFQGGGAAMASPAALSLITLLFPGKEERTKAIGIWGGIAALGGTMGLVISGVLTDLTSWRWIFLINLPVAVVALILLPRLVPESRATVRTRLDVPGAVLGTGAAVSLVWGLLRVGESSWTDSAAVGSLLLSAIMTVAFLAVESCSSAPLVPLSFFALRTRAVANAATLLFSASFYAMAFLLMIHLQSVLDYGPLEAGIAYLPYCAGIFAGMWLSTRMATKLGARWTLVAAFLISAVGLVMLSGVARGDDYASAVLPGMLVTSLGCGLTLPTLSVAALAGTNEEDAGLGSAIFSSVQQIGGAVGVAVLISLATWRSEGLTGSVELLSARTSGFSFALAVAAVILVFGAALIAVLLRGPRTSDAKSAETPGRPMARSTAE